MKKICLSVIAVIVATCAMTALPQSREKCTTSVAAAKAERSHKFIAKSGAESTHCPSQAVRKAPAGNWEPIGQGTYSEDLLTYYWDVPVGLRWAVDIEESAEQPGWYRFIPYGPGSPIAEYYGSPDGNYLYINATDPDKVYVEDFWPYQEEISNLVPDTGWPADSYQYYGTLSEGIISFKPGSFAIGVGTGWQQTSMHDGFMLALPGYKLTDYSLSVKAPYCADDNNFEIHIRKGESLVTLYMLIVAGEEPVWYVDPYRIVDEGEVLEAGTDVVAYSPTQAGIYTALVAGLDDSGELCNAAHACFIAIDEEPGAWRLIGTGKLNESAYASVYDEIDPVEVDVEVEENINTPGYYRVVNPYAAHPYLGDYVLECAHNHYLYVNATDPARVYIEPSAIGVDYQCGEAALWSRAGSCIQEGVDPDEIEAADYYGKLEDGCITFPCYALLLSEKTFSDGEFLGCADDFRLELPDGSGIGSVSVGQISAPVYYNLQGVRVDMDRAAPGVYIRSLDGRTSKVFVR